MGRIVVTEYISVDGVVEAPSGTETFEREKVLDLGGVRVRLLLVGP